MQSEMKNAEAIDIQLLEISDMHWPCLTTIEEDCLDEFTPRKYWHFITRQISCMTYKHLCGGGGSGGACPPNTFLPITVAATATTGVFQIRSANSSHGAFGWVRAISKKEVLCNGIETNKVF